MKIIGCYSRGAVRQLTETPKVFVFPGGEVQVCIDDLDTENLLRVTIQARLTSSDQVMALLLVTDALRRRVGAIPIHLMMPYVPYARQDRVCNPGEALGAKVFCSLINAQGYASVTVVDPHSDVVSALLDRVVVIDASVAVEKVLRDPVFLTRSPVLVAPDAGAAKKVLTLAKKLGIADVIFADKLRDTKTGNIVSIAVRGEVPADRPLLVIDDICDGGRTFVELAVALREKTDQALYLYVTHGIFSKSVAPLLADYQKLFTTNDWTHSDNANVAVINLGDAS